MKLTPAEKKLYLTLWGGVALAIAVGISLREYRSKPLTKPLSLALEPAIADRFSRVSVAKKGVDFFEFEFELTESFSKSIVRFPKQLALAYVLRRGSFDVDSGELTLDLPPQSAVVTARAANRKKVDFDEVLIRLPH